MAKSDRERRSEWKSQQDLEELDQLDEPQMPAGEAPQREHPDLTEAPAAPDPARQR